jgi:hypothetical protein
MRLHDRILLVFSAIATASALAACSYEPPAGSIGSESTSSTGTVSLAVKSDPSSSLDVLTVDIIGVELVKSDGTSVELLSAPTRIDLTASSDDALLVQSTPVPVGNYRSATITFDFASSTAVLTGLATPAAILDFAGAPIVAPTTFTIDLNQSAFAVVAGQQRVIVFDFDLATSVNADPLSNHVALQPIVGVSSDGGTELVAMGTLLKINFSQQSFTAALEPEAGHTAGNATFVVNDQTSYQIDGVPSVGAAGLSLLGLVPRGASVQVFGAADPSSASIVARQVIAGQGTDSGLTDIVDGVVVNRLGNPTAGSNEQLQILGNARNAQTGFVAFSSLFTANVNFANTRVVRSDSSLFLTTDAINVGQHVRIYGTLNSNVMWANVPGAVVRAVPVHAFGTAISSVTPPVGPTTVTMVLQQIDDLPASAFFFPTSGLTPPNPSVLTVNADALASAQHLALGTPIDVVGFFAPVNDNAQDLQATSLDEATTMPSQLLVDNRANGLTVNLVATPTSIVLEITGTAAAGERTILDQGLAGVVPLPTTPSPTITASGSTGSFTLLDATTGKEMIFTTFATFSNALANALAQGATLQTFGSSGVFTTSTGTMPATSISAVIE